MWIVLRAVSTLPPSTVQLPSASTSPSTHFVCYILSTATFSRPFSYSEVSILRLHSSTSLFYAYTHLWVYSGLYSARRLKMSLFYAYTHLWTYSGLHSARRLLTSLIYPYIHLILRFSGPSLALFSRWQRVHGYTSLIRPRLHSSLHSLHSTSTLSEHFRDPGAYIHPTFYIYI